jgi:anti-sigma-K factor RskA
LRHERVTEELREIAALYVLGSLTQQEARSFESHIKEGCSICEAERRKYEHAVAAIGLSAEETIPPEYVRDLLSARIEREPQIALPSAPENLAVEGKPAIEPMRPRPPSFSMMSQPRNDRPNIFPWILVGVLALLSLLAGNAWRTAREMNVQLQAGVSAAQADADDLRAKLDIHKTGSGNLEQILSTVGRPGTRIARLVLQTASPASSAAIVWDTEKGNCLILGSFPPAPEGKNYQLWFFTLTAKVSAGSFRTDSANRVFVTVPVPREAVNAGAAVVTIEPDNGSQLPTSPYFAVGRIN